MLIGRKEGKSILLSLAFLDKKGWFGGKNRSLQLYEKFESEGYSFERIADIPVPRKIDTLLCALAFIFKYGWFSPLCYSSIQSTGHRYFLYKYIFRKYPEVSEVYIEGTGFGSILFVNYLKSIPVKVVYMPANIESLTPYTDVWTHTLPLFDRFRQEIKYLKKADVVLNISSEEAWILQIFGVNAQFLEYIPPIELQEIIARRKKKRKSQPNGGYLYVGNFDNEPNRQGIKSLINQVVEGHIRLDSPLYIIGRNSDLIKSSVPQGRSDIVFLGELSDEELEEQYQKCKGVYILHVPTSGMLTRVVELMYSGIPVYGNLAALKGYVHCSTNILVQNDPL